MKYRLKTDSQILKTINKHNAMTEPELSKALGYKSLLKRLRTMMKNGKVRFIVVSNNKSCKHKLFRGYAGVKLYYTDKKNLREWVKKHLPKDISSSYEQQAITMRVRRNFKIEL